VALGAAARILLHLMRIDRAFEIGDGLEDRAGRAVGRNADFGQRREQLVRLSSGERDTLAVKSQVAGMRFDIDIAAGDFLRRDRDGLPGRKAEIGVAVEAAAS
jgi:hypothetical protein